VHGLALTFADGTVIGSPDATAMDLIRRGVDRIVEVSDNEIAEAVRVIYAPGQRRLRPF
jgi:threonine dehydratase